ncbi:hypothetical protein MTF65_17960 [Streptomyces sp. APSN-46.1]|uniref:hypothetical protein n=1 Tax=Streptomyces sp. APSN-46.1 TaxID=2929049 RepID=UPI001FB1B060|nr:hypothetical protein [Streptomyces sp. APSN-46.1]MCJ1679192.1 hypothetical protein [Streptomyces sp. APSN-46.1]
MVKATLLHPTEDAREMPCEDCGTGCELFFTVSGGGVTGIDIARAGELRIFRCPADARHGLWLDAH